MKRSSGIVRVGGFALAAMLAFTVGAWRSAADDCVNFTCRDADCWKLGDSCYTVTPGQTVTQQCYKSIHIFTPWGNGNPTSTGSFLMDNMSACTKECPDHSYSPADGTCDGNKIGQSASYLHCYCQ
jgi:hypothetical protein